MKKAYLLDKETSDPLVVITRGEMVLDREGEPAFSSEQFLVSKSNNGLMSKTDKETLDDLDTNVNTILNTDYRIPLTNIKSLFGEDETPEEVVL